MDNKKEFRSNANCPLNNSPRFIVNKFEYVWGFRWGPVQWGPSWTSPGGAARALLEVGSGPGPCLWNGNLRNNYCKLNGICLDPRWTSPGGAAGALYRGAKGSGPCAAPPFPSYEQTNWPTHTTENITFVQLHWQVVKCNWFILSEVKPNISVGAQISQQW